MSNKKNAPQGFVFHKPTLDIVIEGETYSVDMSMDNDIKIVDVSNAILEDTQIDGKTKEELEELSTRYAKLVDEILGSGSTDEIFAKLLENKGEEDGARTFDKMFQLMVYVANAVAEYKSNPDNLPTKYPNLKAFNSKSGTIV